ncbi:hypothetical protein NHQ30_010178 [Ciborinia camelliae]|nr:hypothetical protein NHQ30_010178 [Ciborinia camelliae]
MATDNNQSKIQIETSQSYNDDNDMLDDLNREHVESIHQLKREKGCLLRKNVNIILGIVLVIALGIALCICPTIQYQSTSNLPKLSDHITFTTFTKAVE